MGVRAGHGVRVGERGQLRVLIPRVLVVVVVAGVVFALELLGGSVREDAEVEGVAEVGATCCAVLLLAEWAQARVHTWAVDAVVAVRRRDIGRANMRSGGRFGDDFWRRRHHS